MAKNTLYMHTINSKPAFFHEGEGLLFYAQNDQTSIGGTNKLFVDDLKTIRKQQAIDLDNMVNKYHVAGDYKGIISYMRVRIK